MSEAINVQVIMQEIRERVRKQATHQEPKPLPALPDFSHLERVSCDLHDREAVVGQMPPEPRTLRGRIGALLVRMVRRAIFWQTLQLHDFHADVVEGYDQQLATLKRVVAEIQQNRRLTQNLWTQVADLSVEIERMNRALQAQQDAFKGLLHMVEVESQSRQALENRVDAESRLRENLSERVAAEMAREMSANEQLGRRVDAEVTAREVLQQALETEAGTREDLGRRVDAETAAREALQQAVGAESGAREELAHRVDAEAAAREGLQQALGSEAAARGELAHRVDAEVAAREGLQQALGAEAAARGELGQRVDTEVVSRERLQQALRAETGARETLALEVTENSKGRRQLEAQYRETDIGLHRLRADLSSHSTRISTLLVEARRRLPKDLDTGQLTRLSDEDKHTLDSLYLALEDRFRGSEEEIKERMRYYLPKLQNEHIGSREMPVLDVGCGRGEWIELLSESGLEARGVDTNRIFVAACKERGLSVIQEDALDHLSALPASSIGAVTGFHIIEHLPLDTLVRLVDETIRVLKPGGMAIFETPNPQNVLVGCHNFYIDPTHRNPIPCLLAQFLLEVRGLCNVEIIQLHPYPQSFNVRDGGEDLAQRFNEYFYGPQDYAVIGRRV